MITPKDEFKRTHLQNRALHLWLSQVAETLNDAGVGMALILKPDDIPWAPDGDIPWTPANVKNLLWKPVQLIMTGEESTANASTSSYRLVYAALRGRVGHMVGVALPEWPAASQELEDITTKRGKRTQRSQYSEYPFDIIVRKTT